LRDEFPQNRIETMIIIAIFQGKTTAFSRLDINIVRMMA